MSRIKTVELQEGPTGNIVVVDLIPLKAKHIEDYEQAWQESLQELDEEDKTMSWFLNHQAHRLVFLITKPMHSNMQG